MKDPWIQTGLHGRLHFFRLDRCIVQLSFKAMYVWPLSWLHPDPVPEPRNTRRASTVGLSLLICPRAREQCSDQLMETGGGGGGGCSGGVCWCDGVGVHLGHASSLLCFSICLCLLPALGIDWGDRDVGNLYRVGAGSSWLSASVRGRLRLRTRRRRTASNEHERTQAQDRMIASHVASAAQCQWYWSLLLTTTLGMDYSFSKRFSWAGLGVQESGYSFLFYFFARPRLWISYFTITNWRLLLKPPGETT